MATSIPEPDQASTLLQFLNEGYVVLTPESLDRAYHEAMWHQADRLYEQARRQESPTAHLEILGDNLRAVNPAIDRMLEDPVVAGAVAHILGEHAFLHPHNFVHRSAEQDQPFHQDGNLPWNERGHYRAHRSDWLILFYYPQEVTLDNGPTEIVPCSQYWTTDIERADGSWRPGDLIDPDFDRDTLASPDLAARDAALAQSLESLAIPGLERRFIQVPAGSVVIGNYDLIHRGTRTSPEQSARYMYKFYFARTREPDACPDHHTPPPLDAVRTDLKPIVTTNWRWQHGERHRCNLSADQLERAVTQLQTGGEHQRVEAAYHLGADTRSASLEALLATLRHDDEGARRAAAYGLRLRCNEAPEALTDATRDPRVSVRRFACFALGAAWSPGTAALLERLTEESDDLARSNAAYALGQVARNRGADAGRILTGLIERLRPGAEPDNTSVAGLSRSTVRQSSAYAILQLAANHCLSDRQREALSDQVAIESDRYVLGMLVEAIARHSADAALLRTLAGQRWNAVPAS